MNVVLLLCSDHNDNKMKISFLKNFGSPFHKSGFPRRCGFLASGSGEPFINLKPQRHENNLLPAAAGRTAPGWKSYCLALLFCRPPHLFPWLNCLNWTVLFPELMKLFKLWLAVAGLLAVIIIMAWILFSSIASLIRSLPWRRINCITRRNIWKDATPDLKSIFMEGQNSGLNYIYSGFW